MHDTLIRYLLGSLPDEETERLDELSIADDELAERLRDVENELIDAYVAGELSADDRARFEAVYARSAEGRGRIAFAAALAARTARRRARASWYPAMAAAAVVLLAIGWYSLRQPQRPDLPPGAAPQARVEAPAPSAPAAAPSPGVGAAPASTMLSLVLAAPTRSAADAPTIAVPEGTLAVELRLELEEDAFAEYDATLKDASGVRTLWRSGRVKSAGPAANRAVPIRVPGNLLTARRHVLELRGVSRPEGPHVLGSYAFRVVVE